MFRANGRLTLGAGIATGLAFLVKGPMAPVITLTLLLFESIRRRMAPARIERGVRSRPSTTLAILAMLVIPLLWLVPAVVIGGEPFWREIFFKQTVGRAVGAWVHKSPPWFYLQRAPLTLLPWFFLAIPAFIAAWRRNDERAKFAISWILAVLVPYSLLSSKLDVYMITMLPAVALLIARYVEREDAWGRRANLLMLALFVVIGLAGLFVQPQQLQGDAAGLIERGDVRAMFGVLLAMSIVAMLVTLRGTLVSSTVFTGLVLVVTFGYAAVALVPIANELASTRPLVRALEQQNVPPENVALFVTPHLWTRGMRPELAKARHVDAAELRQSQPELIVARRKDAGAIADVLRGYRRVAELQMIGKWFDVYRR
jgi:4-amino-4-deoxy-L-arabinose transferase-like glycosyltransferase